MGVTNYCNRYRLNRKEYHRAFSKAHVAIEQPSLKQDSTPFFGTLEQSTLFVQHLRVTFDYTFEAHNLFVRYLRILFTWLS